MFCHSLDNVKKSHLQVFQKSIVLEVPYSKYENGLVPF